MLYCSWLPAWRVSKFVEVEDYLENLQFSDPDSSTCSVKMMYKRSRQTWLFNSLCFISSTAACFHLSAQQQNNLQCQGAGGAGQQEGRAGPAAARLSLSIWNGKGSTGRLPWVHPTMTRVWLKFNTDLLTRLPALLRDPSSSLLNVNQASGGSLTFLYDSVRRSLFPGSIDQWGTPAYMKTIRTPSRYLTTACFHNNLQHVSPYFHKSLFLLHICFIFWYVLNILKHPFSCFF